MSDPAHLRPDADGSTPLDPDEAEGLKLTWVVTRGQLVQQEARGLERVATRYALRPPAADRLLDDVFLRSLHRDIFGQVWTWAGRYRTTGKSIGVDASRVAVEVRELLADVQVWLGHEEVDHAAARLHHRLVWIHPFPDGNGRHARVHTDLVLRAHGAEAFTWGRDRDEPPAAKRAAYLAALRRADVAGDVDELVAYCRS